jgi:hypothetical protein
MTPQEKRLRDMEGADFAPLPGSGRNRGGGGGGMSAPAAPAAPRAPSVPLATRAGEAVRSTITRAGNAAVNTAVAGGTAAANIVTAPVRAAGGVVRDFTRAVTGQQPAADAGQPIAGLGTPRLTRTGPVAGMPANPSGPQNGRGGPRNSTAAVTPAAPAVATPAPGTLNTFTGSDGRTVSVDAAPAAPAAPVAAPAAPRLTRAAPAPDFDPQAQVRSSVSDLRDVARTVRSDAAGGLNPMSADAEILRRLENSQGSYFNKGRPGARAAQAQAYLGQLAARQGASAGFQAGATQAINPGATGAVQEGLADQQIAGQARLKRQGIQGDIALERVRQDAPSTIVGEDRVVRLRRGGSASAVTDESGQPIRTAASPQSGALTPKDLLKSYTAEREAIQSSLGSADEKAAAMAALDSNPLYQPLLGQGGSQAAPPLDSFLEQARAANPGVSDDELTAYYNQTYGAR